MLPQSAETSKITPMMQQYMHIKEQYADFLVFYRMGDFYELFFDDAIIAAKTLDITLTRRGKHLEQDIPMCGVPHHAHEFYLQKLIREGFKVAICEQVESPEDAKKRGGYKAVVERKVVRIITQGTLTEDNLLSLNFSNYLLSISEYKNKIALAWADISTGEFNTTIITAPELISEIERIKPNEIILAQNLLENESLKQAQQLYGRQISPQAKAYFDVEKGERKIKEFFAISSISALGSFDKAEVSAMGALLEYILVTQINSVPRLNFPKQNLSHEFMQIDYATMQNLEVFSNYKSSQGQNNSSLFALINKTKTSAGSRLFSKYLSNPLLDISKIKNRLDAVEFFINNPTILKDLTSALNEMPDIERIISRIHLNRSNPRDIYFLKNAIFQIMIIQQIFEHKEKLKSPTQITKNIDALGTHDAIYTLLNNAIEDFPPININEGNFIKNGYNPKLDDYRNSLNNSNEILSKLQEKYRQQTAISNLKIKDNNILGMYIEVSPSQISKVPEHFIHRQTMASGVRYTTDELKEVEAKIVNSRTYSINLEIEIYNDLRNQIILATPELLKAAYALAQLDFFSSLASLALENNYARPTLEDSNNFIIKNGRHPTVELIRKQNRNSDAISDFIANDSFIDDKNKLLLVTGPNMSGKSTYLRQNALLAIMAQVGSFIPATNAQIGIVDKVFCRVGASDNLAKGESTFMVEMLESANILNNATQKSLVILDEIGRGTSTFDGLSIAWAMVEHLHDNIKARCLFATHYHELTSLKNTLQNLNLLTIEVKEWNGNIIFMHKVITGAASSSYGVHVAKIAGLPKNVVDRANEILEVLNSKNKAISTDIISADLPLFNNESSSKITNELANIINDTNLDSTTPKQALEILYQLKQAIKG